MGSHNNRFFRREKKHKDKWRFQGKHSQYGEDVSIVSRTDFADAEREKEPDCRSPEEGALCS